MNDKRYLFFGPERSRVCAGLALLRDNPYFGFWAERSGTVGGEQGWGGEARGRGFLRKIGWTPIEGTLRSTLVLTIS